MKDDTISRQAAIDEIKALYEWHDIVTEDRAIDHFKRLPSAQPEIIRCKDCMFWRRDRISCEGYAMCQTGEGGIRFRRENDYCSVARRRTDE